MEGALFQQYPFESIQLFRKTILFGALCAFCTTIPTMYYLNKSWDSEAMCDRILRVYHCFRILLFVGQFYPRTVIYRKLTDVNEQRHLGREIVVEHLLLLLHTKEWRINQFIGVVVYSFFAIALTSLFFFPDWCVIFVLESFFCVDVVIFCILAYVCVGLCGCLCDVHTSTWRLVSDVSDDCLCVFLLNLPI